MRRFHVEKREHYTLYNKLSREIRDIAKKIRDLNDRKPNKLPFARRLLGKLYEYGAITTADTLERCDSVSASSFCRRRLPVVVYKLNMAPTVKKAHDFVEQGHIRVGTELVTDPAYLVSRDQSDHVTWARNSKIGKHVKNYNNERDDFEDA